MYGAWQREFMFKASYESLSTNTTEFNLMQQMGLFGAYNTELNQRQGFNTNGTISYRVNTGWVNEDFSSNIQQLLLSERILLNNEPVKLKTKEFDKQKNINNKTINYVLEFEQSTDLINNVI
jgi:negative regulator of genetic competence, sporulation and motility